MVTPKKPRASEAAHDAAEADGHVLSARFADPDLVERLFDFIVFQLPEVAGQRAAIERVIRDEFGGERGYVRRRSLADANPLEQHVAALFNGRNASEVARRLQISRATVYRLLKQPGRP